MRIARGDTLLDSSLWKKRLSVQVEQIMATAQARRKPPPRPPRAPVAPKVGHALRELGLLVLAFVAMYLFIALASYTVSDPGWSHTGVHAQQVANKGGRLGAWLADFLLHLFGIIAYILPLLLAVYGWRIYAARNQVTPPDILERLLNWGGVISLLVGACGLISLYNASHPGHHPYDLGGMIGSALVYSLFNIIGGLGATLLLLAAFLIGVTLTTGISWLRVMDQIGALAFRVFERLAGMFEQPIEKMRGKKIRHEREVKVAKVREKIVKKAPPRIEPQIIVTEESSRRQQEAQEPLFKDLPTPMPGRECLPTLDLLEKPGEKLQAFKSTTLEKLSILVEKKLMDFNIDAVVREVHSGPVITRFEIEPAAGIKASKITSLANDLARALTVSSVRVVENIPGKTYIGLEIPNEYRETVHLVEGFSSRAYENSKSPLTVVLGKDISGKPEIADLARMPHCLIAGTTGSGKSVSINALILSLLYKATPEEVRLILVDPKMLELSVYEGIPHLLAPVVTDMNEAASALRWSIAEMERRYKLMSGIGVRNIVGYNKKVKQAIRDGKPLREPILNPDQAVVELEPLPYIVIVIDELADMMMVVGKKVEELIARLAQKARAAGIHLVLATQRPSVDVITGLIKANIPARIAFQVSSRIDSRTILDQMGAETLLGMGDMLYLPPGTSMPIRVHGAFVSDEEVHDVVDFLKSCGGEPRYNDDILHEPEQASIGGDGGGDMESDELYDRAVRIVTETRQASISSVQRRLRIGYNRAARMIESMEAAGVIGPPQHNGKREVLAPPPVDAD